MCAQGKWPFQPELIVVSIVWSNKKSYYSPLVTHRDEKLLPSRGKSCYPWGKSCYFQGGRVVTLGGRSCYLQGRRVITFRGKSCYPRGEELLPSGGEELLPSGGRVHLTQTFFSFLISLWDWNCSCHIFTRCDANCCRPSRIYHVKCVRAHMF